MFNLFKNSPTSITKYIKFKNYIIKKTDGAFLNLRF